MRKRICLNMIVKNESAVIERCLASLRDHIDAWVIVDTGSTDDTKEKIRKSLEGIPGALHERPWRNFGSNRSEAVALAYESGCDYFLFFDADDVLLTPPGFEWPELTAHVYELTLNYGAYRYARASLVSSKLHWRWVGVLHEYPESTQAATSREALPNPQIRASTEGARSRDPYKYDRDAEALLQGLKDEPGNVRYQFYLAQSYRDAGKPEQALVEYEKRAAMGGWDEEVWRSMLEAARLKEMIARPAEEISMAYLNTFANRPIRAEPLADLARIARLKDRFAEAYQFAKHASTIQMPADRLFVEAECYTFRVRDELSISAYWIGRFQECMDICNTLLSSDAVPSAHVDRVTANRNFAQAKLG
jgi:glycosyltransferase involved in cell wall biosynthesis